jgi:hypothetical protein
VLERLVLCYEQPCLADHMVIGALSISSPRSATSPLTTAGRGREGRGRVRPRASIRPTPSPVTTTAAAPARCAKVSASVTAACSPPATNAPLR